MPRIANWYTCGSPYEQVANENAKTFAKAGCQPLSIGVNGMGTGGAGDWILNCNKKPEVCLTIIKELQPGEGCLLLDADATVEQPIPWADLNGRLGGGPCLGYVLHEKKSGAREVLSGTLWVTKTPECIDMLTKWLKLCRERPTYWDQKNLASVVGAWVPQAGGRQLMELDWRWAWIEGQTDRPRSRAFIVHHQMSRQVREQEKQDEDKQKPPESSPAKERVKAKGKGKPLPVLGGDDAATGAGADSGAGA